MKSPDLDSEPEELSDDESSVSEESNPLEEYGLASDDSDSNHKQSMKSASRKPKLKPKKDEGKSANEIAAFFKKAKKRMDKGFKFFDYGPPYTSKDPGGHLGTECAEEFPSYLQIHLLLNNRANPNISDETELYFTPMHWCARFLHYQIMKMLRKAGAVIDPINEFGQTPLSLVVLFHQPLVKVPLQMKCVRWLVEQGEIDTIFLLKCRKIKISIRSYVGANVNHIDRGGYSPIDFAAMNRRDDMVAFLLENGAEIRHINNILVVKRQSILSYISDAKTRILLRTRLEMIEKRLLDEKNQREVEKRHVARIAEIRERHIELAEFRLRRAELRQKKKDDGYMKAIRGMHQQRVQDEVNELAQKPAFDTHKYGVWKKVEETSTWEFQTESSVKARADAILPASKKLMCQLRDRHDFDKFNARWKAITGNELEVSRVKTSLFNVSDGHEVEGNKSLVDKKDDSSSLGCRDENDDELVNEDINDLLTY